MPEHKLDTYKDEYYKWITFCKVCGIENPTGECSGKFVQKFEEKDKKVVTKD